MQRCREKEKVVVEELGRKRQWQSGSAASPSLQRVTVSCVIEMDQSACTDGCDGTWMPSGDPLVPSVAQLLQRTTPRQALDCLSRRVGLGIVSSRKSGNLGSNVFALQDPLPCPESPDILCAALFLSIETPPHARWNPQILCRWHTRSVSPAKLDLPSRRSPPPSPHLPLWQS